MVLRVKEVARGHSIFSGIRFWELLEMALSLENTEVPWDLTNHEKIVFGKIFISGNVFGDLGVFLGNLDYPARKETKGHEKEELQGKVREA